MTALEVLEQIASHRLVLVVRGATADDARRTIDAAVAGGVRVVEVTYTIPGAGTLLAELRDRDDLVLGAGTVRTLDQAHDALAAGARFLVSPGLDVDILRLAVERDVLMIPGLFTATEVMTALSHGALAVKLFPANHAGADYLRALHGPMPELKVMPSGGITADNAARWLDAGAVAIGIGGALSPGGPIDDLTAQTITSEARRTLLAIHSNQEGEPT